MKPSLSARSACIETFALRPPASWIVPSLLPSLSAFSRILPPLLDTVPAASDVILSSATMSTSPLAVTAALSVTVVGSISISEFTCAVATKPTPLPLPFTTTTPDASILIDSAVPSMSKSDEPLDST